MAYPAYIREKARTLRSERGMTIDELSECLALPRTTVYYWVRDITIDRKPPTTWPAIAHHRAAQSNRRRFARLREEAYEQGRLQFAELSREPTFRDFVVLFMAEGYKRSRNVVSIANSDPALVRLANRWITRNSRNPVRYSIQYHADQDLDELRTFWASELAVEPTRIRFQRKSNSHGLAARTWRSRWGVLTVRAGDTYFRSRLQAWIDCIKEQWLDSAGTGV